MTVRVIVELEVVQLGVDVEGVPRLWLTSAPPAQVAEWINKSNHLFEEYVCHALPEDFADDYPLFAEDYTWIRIPGKDTDGDLNPLMSKGERMRKRIDDRFGFCTVEVYTQCMFTSLPLEDEVIKTFNADHRQSADQPDCD